MTRRTQEHSHDLVPQGDTPAFQAKTGKIAGLSGDFKRVPYVIHLSIFAQRWRSEKGMDQ